MKSCFAAAIAIFLLVVLEGCGGKPAVNQNVASQSVQPAAQVAPTANSPVDTYPVPESPTPTIADADRPGSIDEFRAQVFRRYQEDMYAPFIELAYWGSSNDEQKKEYLSQVRSAARHLNDKPSVVKSIDDLEVFPIGENENVTAGALGRTDDLPLFPKPTHFVRITWHFVEPSQQRPAGEGEDIITTSATLPVGVHDGKYYFCTIKYPTTNSQD
ncbi:MAG TPA: hypothetical protein VG826_18795 [Pirellulales bacterium]|nr:hypothetical protein [Pirellulales bacterium]